MNSEKWLRRLHKISLMAKHPREVFSRNPVYVFHHIPKSGGMSVAQALDAWFVVYRDYSEKIYREHTDAEFLDSPCDLRRLHTYQCLCGHFGVDGIHLHQRYPDMLADPRFRLFTFIRDPLQTRISLHYFEHKRGIDSGTLAQNLGGRHNYIAGIFPCTASNYQQVLDRYFFIGITDQSQRSLDCLADRIGRPRVHIPVINTTARDREGHNLPAEIVEKFKQENQLDYLIYNYALARLERECSR